MADAGAGLGAGHSGAAGVGEQVQHTDGTACGADLLHGEVPVGGLLRKEAGVLEVHGLDLKRQVLVADRPALRQLSLVPVAAAGGGAGIPGVGGLPAPVAALCVPDGLGVGAHQYLPVPALQLFAAAAVQQLVILPILCDPHTGRTSAFEIVNQFIIQRAAVAVNRGKWEGPSGKPEGRGVMCRSCRLSSGR